VVAGRPLGRTDRQIGLDPAPLIAAACVVRRPRHSPTLTKAYYG
jgi:hypothetical protein